MPDPSTLLFDAVASRYREVVEPFMLPLARDLARQLVGTFQTALDVGTGTGVLARELPANRVLGIDTSAAMLHHVPADTVRYVQADIQKSAFAPESFDLIASSFGLNATQPRRTFKAFWRLLRPGAMVLMQEWGAMDAAIMAVQSVLEQFTPFALEAKLAAYTAPFADWENLLQEPDDYAELLAEIGFTDIQATESAPVTISADREAFLRYQLVWPSAQAVLAAQVNPNVLYDALREVLPAIVSWSPALLRVQAQKPG